MVLPGGLTLTELVGLAMLLVGGLVLTVSLRHVWRATAALRATDRNELTPDDAGSLVRVTGTISNAEDVFVAPFSGTDCVALRYQIEERRLSIPYVLPWYVTVHEGAGAVGFDIQTETGTVSVAEPARTVALTTDVVTMTGPATDSPERISRFEQESQNVPVSTVWRDPPAVVRPLFTLLSIGARRYSEQRATPGDKLTVVGRVPDGGSGLAPVVVSDQSPVGAVVRMAKTSLGGLVTGLVGVVLGVFLLVGV